MQTSQLTTEAAESRTDAHRVVLTGIGVFSSIGTGVTEFSDGLRSGRSGMSAISAFDTTGFEYANGCQIHDFDAGAWLRVLDPTSLGRASQFSVAGARMAVSDSGWDVESLRSARGMISVGTTDGESYDLDELVASQLVSGYAGMDTSRASRVRSSRLSVAVAWELGLTDVEAVTIPTACAAGNYAIGYGYDAIRSGDVDFALCGGADAMCRKTFAGFYRLGTIAPDVCRPFDVNRRGILTGEGAGILMLESLESAERRGARRYAEILGYGINCDGLHPVAPDQDSVARCISLALKDAGVKAEEVDFISAHGTGTKANDVTEASAIVDVFGADAPPTISIKSMLGHTMGAASALAAIACSIAINEGFVPPTPSTTARPIRRAASTAYRIRHARVNPRSCRTTAWRSVGTTRSSYSRNTRGGAHEQRSCDRGRRCALQHGGRRRRDVRGLHGGALGRWPAARFRRALFSSRRLFEIADRIGGVDKPYRATEFLIDAVRQALLDADLPPSLAGIPVLVGTGLREPRSVELWWTAGADVSSAELHFGTALRNRLGAQEVHTLANACSASLHALALACDLLESGIVDTVVVAGADSVSESMFGMADRVQSVPPESLRPFDVNRQGTILGEGAAAIVLTTRPRGRVLATVRGVEMNCDAGHATAPSAANIETVMAAAHRRAQVEPSEIDLVMLHGTGTHANDEAEASAMNGVFGDDIKVPVMAALKSITGHTSGASGLHALIMAIRSMEAGRVGPVVDLDTPIAAAEHFRFGSGELLDTPVRIAQINGFGFGGVNAVAVIEAAR